MNNVRFYIDVALDDQQKLIDFATKLYQNNCDLDLQKEMNDYPDDSYKIVRSLFEVLIGSGERDYNYADAGFKIESFGDE